MKCKRLSLVSLLVALAVGFSLSLLGGIQPTIAQLEQGAQSTEEPTSQQLEPTLKPVLQTDSTIKEEFDRQAAAPGVVNTRILDPGDNLIHGFIFYNGYLWASTRTSPGRVLKIDPTTLNYQRIVLTSGLNEGEDIIAAGGYIWVILATSPARLIRVNPDTLQWQVAIAFGSSELSYGGSLEYAFGYLWVGGYDRKIAKVDLANLTYQLYHYPFVTSGSQFHALTTGGGYLWASAPHYSWGRWYANTILKINPNNPVDHTSVYLSHAPIADDIAYTSGNLYAASEASPSRLYKFADNLSYTYVSPSSTGSYGVFSNPSNPSTVFATYIGSPGKVIEFGLNLNVIRTYTFPVGFNHANEIAFDDAGHMYVTAWESPAKIVKFALHPIALHPIVLLPGIPGSRLSNSPQADREECVDRPEGEIWLDLGRLFLNRNEYNQRLSSLILKDNGSEPDNACDEISASGIIHRVVRTDYYGNLIETLQEDGYTVFEFPYDWRLDLEENAQRLDTFISQNISQSMLLQTDAPKVILIGHSGGGLVARQYVANQDRGRRVAKVITVGTPYWGAPEAAYRMRAGHTGSAIDRLLESFTVWRVVRNAPALMYLLPPSTYFRQLGADALYYEYQEHATTEPARSLRTYDESLQFFTDRGQNGALIQHADNLHQIIDNFQENLHVDDYYVMTAGHKIAVSRIREFPCKGDERCWYLKRYWQGDGTVPLVSAHLRGLQGDWSGHAHVCTFPRTRPREEGVKKEHGELMSDPVVIHDIRRILQGEQPEHCQSRQEVLAQVADIPDPLIQVAVLGSARASVRDAVGNFTGITDEGLIVNEVPLASYHLAGSGTFIAVADPITYTIEIQYESDIPVQVHITDMRAPSIEDEFIPHERAVFVDVPAAAGGVATLGLDLTAGFEALRLEVDLDDDGEPDLVLPPTSILDEGESQDITAPTTTLQVQGSRDEWDFYTGPVTVTLSATDVGTGVLKTEYSLDGGDTWQLYDAPVHIVAEDVFIVHARSVDRAGNHEYPWPSERLRPCYDFEGDGEVTVTDVQAVAGGWRLREGADGWVSAYDADGDGVITVRDIQRVAAQFGVQCK